MTVLGKHTAEELSDLLAAKDYEQKQTEALFASLSLEQRAFDPSWWPDFVALKKRYAEARAKAQEAIDGAWTPYSTFEDEWTGVLNALTPDPNNTSRAAQGLYNRVIKMGAKPTAWNVPQPSKGNDSDLNLLNTTESADVAGSVGHTIDQIKTEAQAAKNAVRGAQEAAEAAKKTFANADDSLTRANDTLSRADASLQAANAKLNTMYTVGLATAAGIGLYMLLRTKART